MAYGLLKGKRGIIFGALNDMSIAWKIAENTHEEGARFTLTNTPVALRLGTEVVLHVVQIDRQAGELVHRAVKGVPDLVRRLLDLGHGG